MSQTRLRQATVRTIKEESPHHQEVTVELQEGVRGTAINYTGLVGPLEVGDRVIINTTAVTLQLGTGGYHFVLCKQDSPDTRLDAKGHAIKLRYTPVQFCCDLIEEHMEGPIPPRPLADMPVVVCEIHSQLPLVLAGIRARLPRARLAYILTEGGALPGAVSHLLRQIRSRGLVDVVMSAGQAFGGDYEAVNVYSALVAARLMVDCDAAVIAMGPGQLGSGTELGFSGTEQADNLNRVSSLGGIAVAVLRLSHQDPRPRHQGISHHTVTVLNQLTLDRCLYAFPRELVSNPFWQRERNKLQRRHWAGEVPGTPAVEYLERSGFHVETMGRAYQADPAFFLAAGAAGELAARLLKWDVRLARYSDKGSRGQERRKARTSHALPLR